MCSHNSNNSDRDSTEFETSIDIVQDEILEKSNLLMKNNSEECFENIQLEQTTEVLGITEVLKDNKVNEQSVESSNVKKQISWSRVAPYLALLFATLQFSSMQVIAKKGLDYLPPQAFALFRVSLALIPLGITARIKEGKPQYSKKANLIIIIMGILGIGSAQSLIFVGIYMAGPDIAAVMQPTIPIYVSIYSMMLKIEQFSWWKIIGQALAISGCLVLVQIDNMNFGNQVALGTIIMIIQTMSYAIFLIIMNTHLKKYPYPFTSFFRASIWGWICMIIIFFITQPNISWKLVPWWAWGTVVYCGIGVSYIAHGIMAWAVAKVQAVIPSLCTCLQPLITTVLAWVFLNEVLSSRDVLAMIAIILGLVLVVWAKFRESSKIEQKQIISEKSGKNGFFVQMSQINFSKKMFDRKKQQKSQCFERQRSDTSSGSSVDVFDSEEKGLLSDKNKSGSEI